MNKPKNKFNRFLAGKGIYVALAVCLAAAGTAAWVTVNNAISQNPFTETPQAEQIQPQENIEPPAVLEQPVEKEAPTAPVEQKQPDVIKEESEPIDSSSSSSNSVSSFAEPDVSASVSESLQLSDESQTLSFILPLNTQVLSPFSGDKLVENRTLKEWRTHNGVDLKAEIGDSVKSACDGKITAISFDPLWGTSVEVSAEDYVFTYCGLNEELPIKLNDHIEKGEIIGSIDNIPCEAKDGAHLHFSVSKNNEYIDPLSLLSE